jgi:hypothetical protein
MKLLLHRSLLCNRRTLHLLATVALGVAFHSFSLASSGPPISENAYCEKGNVPKFGDKDGPAELPKSCYYTGLDGTPSPGKQIRVAAQANLFEAVDRAKCGDTLLLPAGASFEIRELPKKGCDDHHYITIRTDTPDSKLPAEGSRISPAWAGVASLPGRPAYAQPPGAAAKLMATILLHAVPFTTLGDHYRFIGIEWSSAPGAKTTKMINTTGADHVIFDRNWFHPAEGVEMAKGVLMNGDSHFVAVVNSYFSNFNCVARSGSCTDASALGGGVGAHGSDTQSTLKIYNNYLEASGENILFGGAGSEANPTDIEIRRNHLFKPTIWKEGEPGYTPAPSGDPYIVKNNFELKNARRALIEANLFENSWGGFTQHGFSMLLTPRNQNDNCPKCLVVDITLRYNRIRNVAAGLEIGTALSKKGGAATDGGRISIHDLIVDSVRNTGWVGKGTLVSIGSHQPQLHDVAFDHVTAFATGSILQITSREEKILNFSLTNSVLTSGGERPEVTSGGGGDHCAAPAQRFGPEAVLKACFSNYRLEKNLIVGRRGGWPPGNIVVSSLEAAGLRELENGISKDARLCRAQAAGCRKASPGVGAGTDGKDLGADVDAVDAALAGVE